MEYTSPSETFRDYFSKSCQAGQSYVRIRVALSSRLHVYAAHYIIAYFEHDVNFDDVMACINNQLVELVNGVELHHSALEEQVHVQAAVTNLRKSVV